MRYPPLTADNQLTRRTALSLGALCLLCGLFPILGGLGVIDLHRPPDVPAWMGVAAGSVFLLAGVILFADAAAGGTNPDGSLPATAPAYVRHIQTATGASIVLVMTVMVTWIAFGKGERHFSTTISLPFAFYRSASSGLSGRVAFGIAAVLMWLVMILGTVAALKRHVARLRSA